MKSSTIKNWVLSAKVFTTIVWIIFPACYIVTYVSYNLEQVFRSTHTLVLTPDIRLGIIIPPYGLLAPLVFFAVVPAILPSERFFMKRGSENVVIEYQYIKKILYVSLIVLIIAIVYFVFFSNLVASILREDEVTANLTRQMEMRADLLINKGASDEENTKLILSDPQMKNLTEESTKRMNQILEPLISPVMLLPAVYITIYLIPVVPVSIILKLLLEHSRDRFNFCYARSCLEIANRTSDDIRKARFLRLGLEFYNKFLKRITRMHISDMETIYAKIVRQSQLGSNQMLAAILDTFYKIDVFNPMRHMLALPSDKKEGYSLIADSLKTRIKESGNLIIPIVTIVITIITTFFIKPVQP